MTIEAWTEEQLAVLAEEVGCDKIETEKAGAFAAIWLVILIFGVLAAIGITLIYRYFFVWKDKEEEDKGMVRDIRVCPPSTATKAKQAHRRGQHRRKGMDPRPDIEAARKHLKASSPVDADGNYRGIWSTPLKELTSVGGPGLGLYFRLLALLGLIFSYQTLCSVPLLIFNRLGRFTEGGSDMPRTSVANLGAPAVAGVAQENRLVVVNCQAVTLANVTDAFGWFDFVGTCVLTGFTLWFRFRKVPHAFRKGQLQEVTCSDFTLEVDCLPPNNDTANFARDLAAHFQGRVEAAREEMPDAHDSAAEAKVCDTVLVFDRGRELDVVKQRAELKLQKDIVEYKGEDTTKIEEKIKKISEDIDATQAKGGSSLPVLRAFLTLNSSRDVNRLLHMYRFGDFRLLRNCQSEELRFNESALRLRRAPEPSNLIWQNQDAPQSLRLRRKFCVFLVWLLIMGIGLLLMYLTSKQANDSLKKFGDQSVEVGNACSGVDEGLAQAAEKSCHFASMVLRKKNDEYVLFNQTLNTPLKDQSETAFDCYCTGVGLSKIARNSTLRTACRPLLEAVTTKTAISIFAALIVVVVNVCMSTILMMIAEYELPLSVSALNKAQILKVFVAQTLNTAFMVYFVHMGDYSDVSLGWYLVVGASISMTMASNTVCNALCYFVFWAIPVLKRRCVNPDGKHQAEILEIFTNPPWDMASRYAYLLMTVFVTVIWSPGLPILNVFAVLYCVISYWSDKAVLLRGSCRPPQYDCQMPRQTASYLCFAGFAKCITAIAMYGHPCVFPSNPLGGTLGRLGEEAQANLRNETASNELLSESSALSYKAATFVDRLGKEPTWMFSVLFFTLLGGYFTFFMLKACGSTFGSCFAAICVYVRSAFCPKQVKISPEDDIAATLVWAEARERIEVERPPASYRIEEHPDFAPLKDYLGRVRGLGGMRS